MLFHLLALAWKHFSALAIDKDLRNSIPNVQQHSVEKYKKITHTLKNISSNQFTISEKEANTKFLSQLVRVNFRNFHTVCQQHQYTEKILKQVEDKSARRMEHFLPAL